MSIVEIDTYTVFVDDSDDESNTSSTVTSWFIVIFMFAWIVAGIIGFLWSITCFGKSGTMAQQWTGLLLAIFFGPLFWIYYFSVKKYCR